MTSTVRWDVAGRRRRSDGLKRLIGLVLGGAQRLGAVPERAADIGDLGEHGELEKAAHLPGAADPRLELRARQHDERRDEERGEETRMRHS